jgi:hypothetical protein
MTDHWDKIFSEEFGIPEADAGEKIEDWVDKFAVQEDFESFYSETVEALGDTPFTAGENSAYSLRSVEEGRDMNCDGKAFLAAAAGNLAYGKNLEIIVDYAVDTRPSTWGQELVSHHSVVEDDSRNT